VSVCECLKRHNLFMSEIEPIDCHFLTSFSIHSFVRTRACVYLQTSFWIHFSVCFLSCDALNYGHLLLNCVCQPYCHPWAHCLEDVGASILTTLWASTACYRGSLVHLIAFKFKQYDKSDQAEFSFTTLPVRMFVDWMTDCHVGKLCIDCSQNIYYIHSVAKFPSHLSSLYVYRSSNLKLGIMRHQVPMNHWYLSTKLHSLTSQKTV
jgi:hypothetical protein